MNTDVFVRKEVVLAVAMVGVDLAVDVVNRARKT